MKAAALVCAAALALGGCAITEDAIAVKYDAPANISVVPGAKDVKVSVTTSDGRVANRDRVSSKKNGYGMEMARITASNDVVAEVGRAVQAELASLGFQVAPGGIEVAIETITFYNDFKTGFFSGDAVAEVAFNLTAKEPSGALVYSRGYRAVGMNKNIMLAVGSTAEVALREALRNAVQQMVADSNLHQAIVKAGTKPKIAAIPTS